APPQVNEIGPFGAMNRQQLRDLLVKVGSGDLTPEAALERLLQFLRQKPYDDLGVARVDNHRNARQGFPEVVFGQGKTPEQIAAISVQIVGSGQSLLVTRTSVEAHTAIAARLPQVRFHDVARCITLDAGNTPRGRGTIVVAAAGTADLPVAEEAAVSAEIMGN